MKSGTSRSAGRVETGRPNMKSGGGTDATARAAARLLPRRIDYCKSATMPCVMGTGENVAKRFGRQLQ
jgi:hypothetical protein